MIRQQVNRQYFATPWQPDLQEENRARYFGIVPYCRTVQSRSMGPLRFLSLSEDTQRQHQCLAKVKLQHMRRDLADADEIQSIVSVEKRWQNQVLSCNIAEGRVFIGL